MRVSRGRAPAKAILAGEHAVVHGRAAVSLPLFSFGAETLATSGSGVFVTARGLDAPRSPADLPEDLAWIPRLCSVFAASFAREVEDVHIEVRSSIPEGRGLGSGAAVAAATIRALAGRYGLTPSDEEVSAGTFEVEKLHHGRPSGVDNSTVSYGRPVLFKVGAPPRFLSPGRLTFVLADAGPAPATAEMVERVGRALEAAPGNGRTVLDEMDRIALEAADALEKGDASALGVLLDRNQEILRDLGASTQTLDTLCRTARQAGAWGAKLTGAGGGGFLLALTPPDQANEVLGALEKAGASHGAVSNLNS
jgi:mevalonate kinase